MSILRTIAMFIYLFGYMILHYGILRRQGSEEFLHSRQKFISLRPQMSVVNDQRAIHIENPRFGKRRQA